MIEVVNCYYIYTLSNDLIMNMNSKNQDHYGGDYNKRFNRATMVEIITRFKQGHYEGNYNKGFKQGHYGGKYNNRFNQGHYGGNIEQ